MAPQSGQLFAGKGAVERALIVAKCSGEAKDRISRQQRVSAKASGSSLGSPLQRLLDVAFPEQRQGPLLADFVEKGC